MKAPSPQAPAPIPAPAQIRGLSASRGHSALPQWAVLLCWSIMLGWLILSIHQIGLVQTLTSYVIGFTTALAVWNWDARKQARQDTKSL